jgi:hypothetical protein
MSLPASQQRVLDRIEDTLKNREPRLADMFAMFTRLTTGEGPPRTEVVETVPWWSPRRRRIRLPARAALLLSLAVVLVLSVGCISMSGSHLNCPASVMIRGSVTVQNTPKTCPAVPGNNTMGMGHGP